MNVRVRLSGLVSWSPVAAATVYTVSLGFVLQRLWTAWYWSSDAAAPLLIAERFRNGTVRSGPTYIAQPLDLFLDLLTRHLPLHSQIWRSIPLLTAALTIALIGWSVARIAGPWPAAMTIALGVSVTPSVLSSYLTQVHHGFTWLGAALAGAFVVAVTRRQERLSRGTAVKAMLVAAAIGVGAASDFFLAFDAIAPLAVTGAILVLWSWRSRRPATPGAVVLGTACLSSVAMIGARWLFTHQGLVVPTSPVPVHFATSLTALRKNASLLTHGFVDVTAGPATPTNRPIAALVIGSTIVAVGALVLVAQRFLTQLHATLRRRRVVPESLAATVFWCASGGVVAVAFLFSGVAVDAGSARYLTPVFFALMAAAPLAVKRTPRWRLGSALAAALIIITSIAHLLTLAGGRVELTPDRAALPALIRVLDARGLHRGYANYWYANSVSWITQDRLEILPVLQGCGSADRAALCADRWEVTEDVFRPRDTRTFVLVQWGAAPARQPSRKLYGNPRARLIVDRWTVYVYDRDVAAAFVRNTRGR